MKYHYILTISIPSVLKITHDRAPSYNCVELIQTCTSTFQNDAKMIEGDAKNILAKVAEHLKLAP